MDICLRLVSYLPFVHISAYSLYVVMKYSTWIARVEEFDQFRKIYLLLTVQNVKPDVLFLFFSVTDSPNFYLFRGR